MKVCEPPMTGSPLEFLTLRLVHIEHQQSLEYILGFITLTLVPVEVSTNGFLL